MLTRLSLALLGALATTAKPVIVRDKSPVTIPFVRRFNFTGASTLAQMDRVRAQSFMCGCRGTCNSDEFAAKTAAAGIFDVSATNGAVEYTVSVSRLVDRFSSSAFELESTYADRHW